MKSGKNNDGENPHHRTSVELKPDAQRKRIEDYLLKMAFCREEILRLTLEAEHIREQTHLFSREYNARVGRLYLELDRLHLEIKELLYRARLVERGSFTTPEQLDKRVGDAFRMERQRVEKQEQAAADVSDEKTAAHNGRPQSEKSPSLAKKCRSLYIRLAKQYHPDKAKDDPSREQRVHLMALINQAYEAGDFTTLEQLEATLPQGEDPPEESPNDRERRFYREYLRLHRTLSDIQGKVERLKADETYQMSVTVKEARERGEDPLDALRRDLTAKVDAAKGRLHLIREQFKTLVARFRGVR